MTVIALRKSVFKEVSENVQALEEVVNYFKTSKNQ